MMANRALAFSLIAFLCIDSAEGTELHLRFKDEQGEKVRLSEAELLLVGWGIADRLELEKGGESLVVPLDESWLRSRWPRRFMDMEKVYLFLRADGYAAIRSQPFLWIGVKIGAHGPDTGSRITKAEIAFPGHKKVEVKEDGTVELELQLRKPRQRYLRLIDDHGKPVAGVKVSSYMFWSDSNHCGYLAGADPLGRAVTDGNGRVSVPDGDFEYAFEFEKPLYGLKHPGDFLAIPPRLVTYLKEEETTVDMHRWQRRPLEMRVTQHGRPAEGKVLFGSLAGCVCGACSGPVAKTNSRGIVRVSDFYPEEWEYVYFSGRENAEGKPIWQADPKKWPKTGAIEVELGP